MGLTSSQGRLLMLTSRLSDIQLEMTLLSQRKNQLALQTEEIAREYNEKISNTKIIINVTDSNESSGYKKKDLTYDDMTSMGYVVTDANNNIYLTKKLVVTDEHPEGEMKWVVPSATNLASDKIFDDDEVTEDENGKATISFKGQTFNVVDGTDILTDKAKLQQQIINGFLFLYNSSQVSPEHIGIDNLAGDSGIEEVFDTSDDAAAETKYNYETARISRLETALDVEIQQLETQHEAIYKEIESVQKVISDNIKRTFDTSGSGS